MLILGMKGVELVENLCRCGCDRYDGIGKAGGGQAKSDLRRHLAPFVKNCTILGPCCKKRKLARANTPLDPAQLLSI